MFRRFLQFNESVKAKAQLEHRRKPARRFTADMLRRVDRGWRPSMQQGTGKAQQPHIINVSAEATAGSRAQREEIAVSIDQGPVKTQDQEVESVAQQTTTSVSMAGGGVHTPAVGGAQPEANLAASASPQECAAQQVALEPLPRISSKLVSKQATAAVQTESSMGRDQPAAVASATVGIQTLSQAEQELCLAQQGQLPLSNRGFKVCKAFTSALQRATQKARQGRIMDAEQDVCTALDKHEEELLVVLGNVPLEGCCMGTFVDVFTLMPTPEAAMQQSQRLLQVSPGHFLGQLGQVLSHSMLNEQHNAEPLLQPSNLAPGPLGIASAAHRFINVTTKTLQLVKGVLKNANLNAVDSVAAMSASAGSGYKQIKEIQEELHRQHGATMSSIKGQEPREWFASFKAVGNMVTGNFSQAEKVITGYLEQYKGQGYPLWAHMLKCYAQMHDTQDHLEIQQIADELRSVVRHARQASVVHLAPEALPHMPTNATAYIQSIEDTARAATQLFWDFDTLNDLAVKLATQWELMTEEEVIAGIADGRDKCSHMLDSTYAGSALSVRLTGRVYGLRARFNIYAHDYILADSDSAYALSLNPHQCQVLAHWLQLLNMVKADKAMSCVVSTAKEAICNVHRSGEECALDEAGRLEQVNYFERQLQTLLADRGEEGFGSIMQEDMWRFFCGQNRKNGRRYLLEMSPDKVAAKAGDFGNHMGLELAYLPQLITSNMAEHCEAMRENQREYHSRFPASMQGERPHADLSVVLGYAPQPPTGQTCEAEDTVMEDASNVSDANRCQDSAPTAPDSSCSARDSPGQHSSSECCSQANSPRCSWRGSFEDGSEGTGAFSPVYVATSPSFSPRGSPESPPSQPAAAEQPPIFADKAGTGRPSTTQQAGRSAFCFGRPARAQAPPAADPEDATSHSSQANSSSQAAAEQTDQSLAVGCGTAAESTAQQAPAHHSAAHAVLFEVTSRLQQAEAEQAQVQAAPTEGEQTQAVQAETQEEQAALSEGEQTQAEAMQTDGMPSGFAQTHSSFFASSSPPHSFATSSSTHTFGGFQAGGEQPNCESGGAPSRRPACRRRQASGARRAGKAAH